MVTTLTAVQIFFLIVMVGNNPKQPMVVDHLYTKAECLKQLSLQANKTALCIKGEYHLYPNEYKQYIEAQNGRIHERTNTNDANNSNYRTLVATSEREE
jgi:hypothetical protein